LLNRLMVAAKKRALKKMEEKGSAETPPREAMPEATAEAPPPQAAAPEESEADTALPTAPAPGAASPFPEELDPDTGLPITIRYADPAEDTKPENIRIDIYDRNGNALGQECMTGAVFYSAQCDYTVRRFWSAWPFKAGNSYESVRRTWLKKEICLDDIHLLLRNLALDGRMGGPIRRTKICPEDWLVNWSRKRTWALEHPGDEAEEKSA